MNRAGRKRLMYHAIISHDTRSKGGALTTAKIAHRAGLVSSSEVVKMLREMADEGLVKEVQIQPAHDCVYTVRAWQLIRWEQVLLPDEWVIINGVRYSKNTGKAYDYGTF